MEKNELNFPATIVAVLCAFLVLVLVVGGTLDTQTVTVDEAQTQSAETQQEDASEEVAQPATDATTTAATTTQATTAATTAPVTQAPTTAAPPQTQAPAAQSDTTAATQTTEPAADALPATPEAILAKYTAVMDKAKAEGPAHKKVEYQAIPEDKVNFEGGVFGKMLPLISNFLKSEEDAKANPEIWEKGNDMFWFPPYKVKKGCMLTDVSKIKSAECTPLPDGNVKITIVLNDESNPEPVEEGATSCDSATGSMFTPIKRSDIDNTLSTDPAIKFIVKDVDFALNYHDCTAELVYNPQNDQIVSLDQYMHIFIDIKSGSLLGMSAVGTAELNNNLHLSDFTY